MVLAVFAADVCSGPVFAMVLQRFFLGCGSSAVPFGDVEYSNCNSLRLGKGRLFIV